MCLSDAGMGGVLISRIELQVCQILARRFSMVIVFLVGLPAAFPLALTIKYDFKGDL